MFVALLSIRGVPKVWVPVAARILCQAFKKSSLLRFMAEERAAYASSRFRRYW